MVLIAHRGNVRGKEESKENSPNHIQNALNEGFDVEIDVWFDGGFFLGHDKPQYKIDLKYLDNPKFWCHAKNVECLEQLLTHSRIHCFWHQSDDVTLTTEGYVWTYPGKKLVKNSIVVLPETYTNEKTFSNCFGICSDYISRYR